MSLSTSWHDESELSFVTLTGLNLSQELQLKRQVVALNKLVGATISALSAVGSQ